MVARARKALYPGRRARELTIPEWWECVQLARETLVAEGRWPFSKNEIQHRPGYGVQRDRKAEKRAR
jgi:hypothetical protein